MHTPCNTEFVSSWTNGGPSSLPAPPRGKNTVPNSGSSSFLSRTPECDGAHAKTPRRVTSFGTESDPLKLYRPVGANTTPPRAADAASRAAWKAAVLSYSPSPAAPKSRTFHCDVLAWSAAPRFTGAPVRHATSPSAIKSTAARAGYSRRFRNRRVSSPCGGPACASPWSRGLSPPVSPWSLCSFLSCPRRISFPFHVLSRAHSS